MLKKMMSIVAVAGLVLALAGSARAGILLYEPFNYTTGTASGSGVLLAGQNGGTGFAAASSWSTFNTGTANSVTVYQEGNLSGVNIGTGAANAFDGTVANLATSGGYFGSIGLGGTANTTDHIEVWRALDASVTATFVDGATTWFSFVSTRAYHANARSTSFAIGAGELTEDRGNNAAGEAIGAGGGNKNQSGVGSNTVAVFPEYWDQTLDSPGETGGSFGVRTSAGDGSVSVLTADSMYWERFLPDGVTYGAPNVVVGKIEWHDGTTPDVISAVRFTQTDTLTEAAFDAAILAQPQLSSANWSTAQPVLDQSQFDTISLGGGRFFADELRIATTFDEVVAIPEPATMSLLVLGGLGLVARRKRKRS